MLPRDLKRRRLKIYPFKTWVRTRREKDDIRANADADRLIGSCKVITVDDI